MPFAQSPPPPPIGIFRLKCLKPRLLQKLVQNFAICNHICSLTTSGVQALNVYVHVHVELKFRGLALKGQNPDLNIKMKILYGIVE